MSDGEMAILRCDGCHAKGLVSDGPSPSWYCFKIENVWTKEAQVVHACSPICLSAAVEAARAALQGRT